MIKTVRDAIDEYERLQKEKDDYAKALTTLCSGTNWCNKISREKDSRQSVKSIYKMYEQKEAAIKELLERKVD